MFSIQEIDFEKYKEKANNRDQVITPNYLENIFFFVRLLLMIWSLITLALLHFESAYVFLAPLNEFLPAQVSYCVGFSWTRVAAYSLLSRKIEYCEGKNKKSNEMKLLLFLAFLLIYYFQQIKKNF